uniref:Uncharacterized protein n=1 Tax=Moniliophthora roreri TaxID=221103 RepID=A0A0W0F634_MONRR
MRTLSPDVSPSTPPPAGVDSKPRPRASKRSPSVRQVLFCRYFGERRQIQEGAATSWAMKSQSQAHLLSEGRKYRDDVMREKEYKQLYSNYVKISGWVKVRDRVIRFERFERFDICMPEMAELEGGTSPEAGNTRSTSSEACNTHKNQLETRSNCNTPPEASNAYDDPFETRTNYNASPEANNFQNNPFETQSYTHNPFEKRNCTHNPFETQNNHNTPSEAGNTSFEGNTPSKASDTSFEGNTPSKASDTPPESSDTPPKSSGTPPNGYHDQDMFSHASGFTISGGQFNNVHGDQANSVGFYAFGIPQLLPQFRIDKSPMLTLTPLEDIPTFLYGQLSLLASSLDLPVFELLLLLAYHSFEPQLIESISYVYVIAAYTVHLLTA